MAPSFSCLRISKNKQNTQLRLVSSFTFCSLQWLICQPSSYELPNRIHTAKVYPIKSSNGSSIIVYGHEQGVKIVWRGGRPFKPPARPSAADHKKSNGADNIISLDSDDEAPSAQAFQDTPEFEEEEDELDDSRPYPETVQVLDLYFGTDVLHLSLLPASILGADGPKWRNLAVLKQKIVFTAACADNLVRLITLPITPPSPTSKARPSFRSNFVQANAGNGSWGETVRLLGGHQKPADGVAMTLDFAQNTPDNAKANSTSDANIVVASHSREMAGLLLLYRVPISSASPHFEPFQMVHLPSPAQSISFNPSLSGQRSSHLLVAYTTGACRIYDFKLLIRNQGSEDAVAENSMEQGTWLISLYPGFQSNKGDLPASQYIGAHAGFGRKTIVDAKWVSGGKAIVVLLNDGEWGVWDIEGVGPGASQGLLGRQSIKGGSLTEFGISGFIDGTAKSRSSGTQTSGSKFVPMTPGTRKSIEPFSGKGSSGPIRGQISVVEVPSSSPTNPAEDSIVFWLGESFSIIPSLTKHWIANARKSTSGNPLNSTPGARATKLESINLQGERCSGIDQIAKGDLSTGLPSDILILGERRFTILTAGQSKPLFQPAGPLSLAERPAAGELDVVGIDQALLRMESGGTNGFGAKMKGIVR
jgi:hypothetical protein